MENIKAKIQGILINCSQKSVIGWAVEESDFEQVAEEIVKNLALSGVVSSFLNKEAESLGVEVNDLYLHLFDDKLYLEKEDKESFYFELEDVREVE